MASQSEDIEMMETNDFDDLTQERKEELKVEAVNAILAIYDIIVEKLPTSDKPVKQVRETVQVDLDISNQISGLIATVFTFLRKSDSRNTSNSAEKYKDYEAKVSSTPFKIVDLATAIEEKDIKINFLVATPLMNLLTNFKCCFDEVRTGVTKFPIKTEPKKGVKRKRAGPSTSTAPTPKAKDLLVYKNLVDYGLNNQHIPLLQGITFPPERRTGLLRSIGPMSQAILLINETRYFNKLTNALRSSLQMLPMKEEIIVALKNATSPGSVAGLLKELGDLLLLSTARSTQKIFYPISVWRMIWAQRGDSKLTFSGKVTQHAFTSMCQNGLHFKMKSKGSVDHLRQVVFHAMYGTYLDDLGILPQITNIGEWNQRSEISETFLKRSDGSPKVFAPAHLTKFSKMAQALQTKTLGNTDPTSTCRPSLSGKRRRLFTREFSSYLKTGRSVSAFSSDPVSLQFSIRGLKDSLIKDMEKDAVLDAGTVSWCTFQNDEFVDDETFRVEEKGIYFYGSSE